MGKKKDKKQKSRKVEAAEVKGAQVKAPSFQEDAVLASDASQAAAAQRAALAAFEVSDKLHCHALETGVDVAETTVALELSLTALSQADAAAEAAAAGRPEAGSLAQEALSAAARAREVARKQGCAKDEQPAKSMEAEKPVKSKKSAKAEKPAKAQKPAKVEEPVKLEAPSAVERAAKAVQPDDSGDAAKSDAVGKPVVPGKPETADGPEAKTEACAPAPPHAARVLDLPAIDLACPTPVASAAASASSSSGMPIITTSEEMPAPGTLPLTKHEQKQRARADARVAKERARKEKAAAKQAAKDERAAERQAKAEAKHAAAQAKRSAKKGSAQDQTDRSEPDPRSAAAAAATADADATAAEQSPAVAPAVTVLEQPKRSHAARNACIVLIILLAVTVGLVAAAWLGLFRLPPAVQDRIDLLPDMHATAGKLNAADTPVAPGSYRLVVNQIPTSQGPSKVVNVEFENPAQNTYSARMDIYLDDTGQLVGSTRMVSPGTYLENLTLIEDLSPGTYQATAKVGVYSKATQVNTMSAALELRIEE